MALFGSKNKAPKEPKKSKAELYLESRGVEGLSPKSYDQVKRIINDLAGNSFFKAGMALSFAKAEEQAKVTYLSALVEQNWILMNQNQEIIDELKNLNEKNNL